MADEALLYDEEGALEQVGGSAAPRSTKCTYRRAADGEDRPAPPRAAGVAGGIRGAAARRPERPDRRIGAARLSPGRTGETEPCYRNGRRHGR